MKAKQNTALQMTEITFIMTAQTTLQGEKDTYELWSLFSAYKKSLFKAYVNF